MKKMPSWKAAKISSGCASPADAKRLKKIEPEEKSRFLNMHKKDGRLSDRPSFGQLRRDNLLGSGFLVSRVALWLGALL